MSPADSHPNFCLSSERGQGVSCWWGAPAPRELEGTREVCHKDGRTDLALFGGVGLRKAQSRLVSTWEGEYFFNSLIYL